MRLNKRTSAILLIFSLFASLTASARTVDFAKNSSGNPLVDKRGNCVRTQWLADQCCDPCGYNTPAPIVENQVTQKQRTITSIDLVRQSIYFDIDKDNIDNVDIARMQDVIKEIGNSNGIKSVKLVGYADRFATDKYNLDLSNRRAAHALDYFRSQGVFNNITVGYGFFGKRKPVTNCPTNISVAKQIACLQADRRVDIEVELLRNKVETYSETKSVTLPPVNDVRAIPGAEKPGTENIEVYSRPIDPNTINFDQNGTVHETPSNINGGMKNNGRFSVQQQDVIAVPTADVQAEPLPAPSPTNTPNKHY